MVQPRTFQRDDFDLWSLRYLPGNQAVCGPGVFVHKSLAQVTVGSRPQYQVDVHVGPEPNEVNRGNEFFSSWAVYYDIEKDISSTVCCTDIYHTYTICKI